MSHPVNIFVVVPSAYGGSVTPDQAEPVVRGWLGQPDDAPTSGQGVTMEAWFRNEVGKVFDYAVTIHRTPQTAADLSPVLDNGFMTGTALFNKVQKLLYEEAGYAWTGNRTMVMILGGGGWAAHEFASPKNSTSGMGMVGDWGVGEQLGTPDPFDPYANDGFPSRGFGHEFAGAMGMFSTSQGDTDDPIFGGEMISAKMKRNLLHNSGDWLRTP